jgi:hypothetical protein
VVRIKVSGREISRIVIRWECKVWMKNESVVWVFYTAKAEMMMTLYGMKVERKYHGQRVKGIVKDYACSVSSILGNKKCVRSTVEIPYSEHYVDEQR